MSSTNPSGQAISLYFQDGSDHSPRPPIIMIYKISKLEGVLYIKCLLFILSKVIKRLKKFVLFHFKSDLSQAAILTL